MKNALFTLALFYTITFAKTGVSANASQDPRLQAPWTAAIFIKDAKSASPSQWKFLCSGTITSAFTVITSRRCVTTVVQDGFSKIVHLRYSDMQVVAGLPTTDLSSRDKYTQFATVGQIREPEGFESHDSPDRDLATIRLSQPFKLTETNKYIRAVRMFETINTINEIKNILPGETLLVSGYSNSRPLGSDGSPLEVHQVTTLDTGTCIDRLTRAYPTGYINMVCAAAQRKYATIPCYFEGAGLVKWIEDDSRMDYYLFGVYSSNSATKTTGSLADKEDLTNREQCTSSDVIFFGRYAYLGRWGISSVFCNEDLAVCLNNRCRPLKDLCNGTPECDDESDEWERTCYNQRGR